MNRENLNRILSDPETLDLHLALADGFIASHSGHFSLPKGRLFTRQIITEAVWIFLDIIDIAEPYQYLRIWSDFTGIPEAVLKSYLDRTIIKLELFRDSPNAIIALREVLRNA